MSIRRIEALGFIVVALCGVIFYVLSLRTRDAIKPEMAFEEREQLEYKTSLYLNITTELAGAVTIYAIIKLLFRVPGEETANAQKPDSQPSITLGPPQFPQAEVESLKGKETSPWKDPLKLAIRTIAESGDLTSSAIGVFGRFELPDGTKLLDTEDVRELREQLVFSKKK